MKEDTTRARKAGGGTSEPSSDIATTPTTPSRDTLAHHHVLPHAHTPGRRKRLRSPSLRPRYTGPFDDAQQLPGRRGHSTNNPRRPRSHDGGPIAPGAPPPRAAGPIRLRSLPTRAASSRCPVALPLRTMRRRGRGWGSAARAVPRVGRVTPSRCGPSQWGRSWGPAPPRSRGDRPGEAPAPASRGSRRLPHPYTIPGAPGGVWGWQTRIPRRTQAPVPPPRAQSPTKPRRGRTALGVQRRGRPTTAYVAGQPHRRRLPRGSPSPAAAHPPPHGAARRHRRRRQGRRRRRSSSSSVVAGAGALPPAGAAARPSSIVDCASPRIQHLHTMQRTSAISGSNSAKLMFQLTFRVSLLSS